MARKKKVKYYVLFGFNKTDKSETGYFADNIYITSELSSAKIFPSENIYKISGFGSPEKWCEFINSDHQLNKGYKFHLVQLNKIH